MAKSPMEPIPPDIVVIPGVNIQPGRKPRQKPGPKPSKSRIAMGKPAASTLYVRMEPVLAEHIQDFCDRENITLGAFFTYAAKLLFERLDR